MVLLAQQAGRDKAEGFKGQEAGPEGQGWEPSLGLELRTGPDLLTQGLPTR